MTGVTTDLKFTYDERRTVEAVAVVVGSAGTAFNYTKLLKILYLADRQALIETGDTITGARFVSMEHGPVLSEIYDRITHPVDETSVWSQFISRQDRFDVSLKALPGDDHLSDYHVELLHSLSEKHTHDNFRRMIDIVHELPEWKDPGKGKSGPLSAIDILVDGGLSPEDIEDLAEKHRYFTAVDRFLLAS